MNRHLDFNIWECLNYMNKSRIAKPWFSLLFTALFAALFAIVPLTTAHAEDAGGFELGAGFGYFGIVNDEFDQHGFHFIITPGYRINEWVGVYVDQGFGGLFYEARIRHIDEDHNKTYTIGRTSSFAGQTVVNAKFFYPIAPVELWGKVGFGAFYTAGDYEHDAAFAFKLGIGCTYPLTEKIGIGGNFDYMIGAYKHNINAHTIDLQVHARYQF